MMYPSTVYRRPSTVHRPPSTIKSSKGCVRYSLERYSPNEKDPCNHRFFKCFEGRPAFCHSTGYANGGRTDFFSLFPGADPDGCVASTDRKCGAKTGRCCFEK